MPSAHSATVSSLACSVLIRCGIESVEFAVAVAVVVAIIVCRDAMCVRKEVEKHAIILKEMKTNCDLKLEIGHDGLEVFAGIVLGIIVAFFVYYIGNISLL